MAITEQSIRTIESLTRLNNSVNGNPRYRVHFTDGSSAVTTSDASFCYAIQNPEYQNTPVEVKWTRAGLIAGLTPAKRTPNEWSKIMNVTVFDPDGWDRRNFLEDWAKPLTKAEFAAKAARSTCRWN